MAATTLALCLGKGTVSGMVRFSQLHCSEEEAWGPGLRGCTSVSLWRGRGSRCCRAVATAAESSVFWKFVNGRMDATVVKGVDSREVDFGKVTSAWVRVRALPPVSFPSSRSYCVFMQEDLPHWRTPRSTAPQSRDTPPKRDIGIASEKDWGINLLNERINESGTNEDGSTWYHENGEDLGENGYRCRWAIMGGQNYDGSSTWKEKWWEKSDWTGYKELGAEKSGENSEGDSWWETWQEVLYQDEWSNLARIERSAQKQAESSSESSGWCEKWWEKYDAKGSIEKGAHKYGRLNEQSWWEKWGEHYNGAGSVFKWTDKWVETELGTKWGDKWEEKFYGGIGSRQGETWHVSPANERWSRTWGEEHFGNGKVHKYGKSTTGESWDIVVDEETYYEAEPHYGWADVIGNSSQLLSIQPQERPPGVFPSIYFGASAPRKDDIPPDDDPSFS